jgi:hypothetical protein
MFQPRLLCASLLLLTACGDAGSTDSGPADAAAEVAPRMRTTSDAGADTPTTGTSDDNGTGGAGVVAPSGRPSAPSGGSTAGGGAVPSGPTAGAPDSDSGQAGDSGSSAGGVGTGGSSSHTDAGAMPNPGSAGDGGTGQTPSAGMAPGDCDDPGFDDADFLVVYEVGPGLEFETPSDVPWESIGPGTLVKIHFRAEPYRDKWVLNYAGSASDPVVVLGVPQDGQLPVISGDGAVTRPELDFTGEERSVIKIGTSNTPDNERPSYITVSCLDIQSAKPGYAFTNDSGDASEFSDNAATITIEVGDHITIENCELHDAGNGLFSAHDTSDISIRRNYIHDNGNAGSIYEHNSYTESSRITFEYNHYGPLCDGCDGNNLKDRSAGTIIRYNWIEDGNRQLDLVETDYDEIANLPEYRQTFVYGNVLLESEGAGNSQILHYGGDGDGPYRAGTLYLYHNTIVSTRSGNTTLARLSTNDESMDARNNILVGANFAILDETGQAALSGNFLPSNWTDTHGSLAGEVTDDGNTLGDDAGFVDAAAHDFHLLPGSLARGTATTLPPEALPVSFSFVPPSAVAPRATLNDPGAFEGE